MTLEEAAANIGAGVVFTPHRPMNAKSDDPAPKNEDGVITSVNSTFVFVRYAGDQGSKATSPSMLRLLS